MAAQDPNAYLDSVLGPAAASAGSASPALQDPNAYLDSVLGPQVNAASATPAASPVLPAVERVPLGLSSSGLKGALSMFGIPNILEHITQPVASWVDSKVPALAGLDRSAGLTGGKTFFPSVAPLMADASARGLVDNPALAPQSGLESVADSGAEALGGAALGGAGAKGLGIATAGGAASGTAGAVAPGHPWLAAGAGLLGGLSVGGIVNKVESALNIRSLANASAEAEANATSAASALDSAKTDLASGRLDSADALARVKTASAVARDAKIASTNAAANEIGTKSDALVQGVADAHGSSATLQDAGRNLQDYARGWLGNIMPAQIRAAWEPVDAAIPSATVVPNSNYTAALSDMVKSGGTNAASIARLTSSLPRALLSDVQAPKQLAELTGKAPPPQTWADAAAQRSALGDAMANPQVAQGIVPQQLARLYAAQTADMRQAALGLGPLAGGSLPVDLFDAANAASQQLHQIAEGPISRIISGIRPDVAADPDPAQVASRLLNFGSKGAGDLGALRSVIPKGVNELTSAALNTTPAKWTTLSPEAQTALVPDASARGVLTSAVGAKAQASDAAKAEIQAANAAHSQTVADAQASAASDLRGKQRSILALSGLAKAASASANAAKSAVEAANPAPSVTLASIKNSLMGDVLGGGAGALGATLLPGLGLGGGTAAGVMAGALAPYALHGAASLVRSPGNVVPALVAPYQALGVPYR